MENKDNSADKNMKKTDSANLQLTKIMEQILQMLQNPGTAAFHFSRNRFRQSLMDSSRRYFPCSLCWEPSAAACYR